MALSGRLVLAALLGLVLTPLPAGALLCYLVVLLAAVLLDLLLAANTRQLRLEREPSPALRLGESGQSVLGIRNTGRRMLRGQLRDAWYPSAGAHPYRQRVAIPAGEQRRLVTMLEPTRRGERTAAQVTVRAYGPIGLAARQRRIPAPGSIRVLPPFTSRRFLPEKLARLRQLDGAVLLRRGGQGSEFDSLRDYVAGDDVRSIDWRATARARDVVVRTWRPERDRHLVLAIDTGRGSAARVGDAPRLDAALDAALLLGAVAARAGDRVGLVAADVAIRGRLGLTAGPGLLGTLSNALFPLEAALVETDQQLLASQAERQAGKRSLVVLFTALDTAAGPELISAARRLATRHQLIVASVGDPRLAELAATRDDAADVYTAAAAELATAARGMVAEQLAGLGALVVDAPPEHFASRVADAYLDLKAAGKL